MRRSSLLGACLLVSWAARAEEEVTLPIPDRPQDAASPPTGWCGETALQEALLHFGVWASQAAIHRAGRSKYPDLHSEDLPTALAALRVRTTRYAPRKADFSAYTAWVNEGVDQGEPVLAGVKILPTEHPEWGLDHFVLVVGHGARGLRINTTWNEQRWADDKVSEGISFKNAFYAIRLRGVDPAAGARAARLRVLEEGAEQVTVEVSCENVPADARVAIERWSHPSSRRLEVREVSAQGRRAKLSATIARGEVSRFQCVVAP